MAAAIVAGVCLLTLMSWLVSTETVRMQVKEDIKAVTGLEPVMRGGISVRLNANGHDDAGEVTVPRHTDGVGVVTGVDVVEDFEGVVNVAIHTSDVLPYKVFTLTSPSRLVVDVKS